MNLRSSLFATVLVVDGFMDCFVSLDWIVSGGTLFSGIFVEEGRGVVEEEEGHKWELELEGEEGEGKGEGGGGEGGGCTVVVKMGEKGRGVEIGASEGDLHPDSVYSKPDLRNSLHGKTPTILW